MIKKIGNKLGPRARKNLLLVGLSALVVHIGATSGDPVFLGLSGLGLAIIMSVMMKVGKAE